MSSLLAACASGGAHRTRTSAVELTQVPFFPQEVHECGPAALATVLGAAGVQSSPEALVPEVYVPARRGSLQAELVAAARRRGFTPYPIAGAVHAIEAELQAGRPVLVLQNLGVRWLPRWHYAVVVGVSPSHVILRSGREARRHERTSRFLRSWRGAGSWGIVLIEPGAMPASAEPERWLEASAALEELGQLEHARTNYERATGVWPDRALAWLALGNAEYRLGRPIDAERAYRRAVAADPAQPIPRNNLAQVLLERGCLAEAANHLSAARRAAPPALLPQIEATARRLDARSGSGDTGSSCGAL